MLKRTYTWYKELSPIKQLFLLFNIYWIIWFSSYLFANAINFFGENRPMTQIIFDTTSMAFFWTFFWNFKIVKSLFVRKQKQQIV